MSLRTDAETIRELANEIIKFEIKRAELQANGGVIFAIEQDPNSAITLTAAQKTALLAVEAGWQNTIKTISAAW